MSACNDLLTQSTIIGSNNSLKPQTLANRLNDVEQKVESLTPDVMATIQTCYESLNESIGALNSSLIEANDQVSKKTKSYDIKCVQKSIITFDATNEIKTNYFSSLSRQRRFLQDLSALMIYKKSLIPTCLEGWQAPVTTRAFGYIGSSFSSVIDSDAVTDPNCVSFGPTHRLKYLDKNYSKLELEIKKPNPSPENQSTNEHLISASNMNEINPFFTFQEGEKKVKAGKEKPLECIDQLGKSYQSFVKNRDRLLTLNKSLELTQSNISSLPHSKSDTISIPQLVFNHYLTDVQNKENSDFKLIEDIKNDEIKNLKELQDSTPGSEKLEFQKSIDTINAIGDKIKTRYKENCATIQTIVSTHSIKTINISPGDSQSSESSIEERLKDQRNKIFLEDINAQFSLIDDISSLKASIELMKISNRWDRLNEAGKEELANSLKTRITEVKTTQKEMLNFWNPETNKKTAEEAINNQNNVEESSIQVQSREVNNKPKTLNKLKPHLHTTGKSKQTAKTNKTSKKSKKNKNELSAISNVNNIKKDDHAIKIQEIKNIAANYNLKTIEDKIQGYSKSIKNLNDYETKLTESWKQVEAKFNSLNEKINPKPQKSYFETAASYFLGSNEKK